MAINMSLGGSNALTMTMQSGTSVIMSGTDSLVGKLSDLQTTDKTNVVSAINELVDTKVDGAGISLSISDGILTATY